MGELLVVTGMSGAGRSTVGATLEDLGWFVIDNLPPSLITRVADLVGRPGVEGDRLALVIGRAGGEPFEDVPPILETLRRSRHRVRVLFLDAPDEVLVRRFEGTRRRHPLDAAGGVEESITDERQRLGVLRADADIVIETGELNVNQLRTRIRELFGDEPGNQTMQTSIVSFGYKFGIPLDVDLLFDCRFIPNPYWVESLRPLSGQDDPVREFVLGQPETKVFLDKVVELLLSLESAFVREGKSYLTIGFGCTGGRHRSVALADVLQTRLAEGAMAATVFHRDIDRS
jgi:UPF0042 nucleotide-binding protein